MRANSKPARAPGHKPSARGWERTSPNNPVGCVFSMPGRRISRNREPRRTGEPTRSHALQDDGPRESGRDSRRTLETCNQVGHTPHVDPPKLMLEAGGGSSGVVVAITNSGIPAEGGHQEGMRKAGCRRRGRV